MSTEGLNEFKNFVANNSQIQQRLKNVRAEHLVAFTNLILEEAATAGFEVDRAELEEALVQENLSTSSMIVDDSIEADPQAYW